ncbi:phenylalanyl-tRNA synthetase beta chain [Parabacteroides sp. PFB2-12]|uniref:phenylalanine--tRNA ligase subunit beta n=1 Tax=unclassified Parabacteroides TaxID=2649774 RepID=UPI002475B4EC|nr:MULTISPECIES: phenylalanine--tRNA ligase subunit beta [unclassified Parabacteroides]MDH6342536.1 phenylalanyl-tRNA synthetase beta chain [Parabacteroides sp. PM6-13]MDH6390188.1 phenylalanyl-tRNA synthetase beta chain [Parabacteroides sp. PFB2-12]
MNISYNWLKDYLAFDLSPEEVADALTSIGLETGGVEEVQTIKGGLEGLFIGEVLTCEAHPNSDHLSVTTVSVGGEEPLQIVCGASNVAAGQKVVVAVNGTKLYKEEESFTIKRSKIRGIESNGMICAEDEIGIGTDHAGIIVLPADAVVGMPAKDYYNVQSEYVLEVDITPNRVDATSHFGVARDLAAYLKQNGMPSELKKPAVDAFRIEDASPAIEVVVENTEACIRYSGVSIKGVTVKESPEWLKNRLTLIGLRPINNVVDITNFVLHEMGQPLHAFDYNKIKGGKVIVKTMPAGTKFVTLDEVERTLTENDLMICNAEEAMCIGGVFGGLDSGVTEATTDVFLESANFNPSWVRKTARRFGLNTDSSFRFERGLDAGNTIYALQRAALLIQEIAGGVISGELQDVYPVPVEPYKVDLAYAKVNSLIGKEIPTETVKSILTSLEMKIVSETPEGVSIEVPVYRFDVQRDVDVIEDILRIYGYNNIEFGDNVKSNLSYKTQTDRSYELQNLVSEQLVGGGFHEIMNNSFTPRAYYEALETYPADRCVMLLNPLSTDLNAMRQTLLFGGMDSIERNTKRRNSNIRFFEFGNCYEFNAEKKDPEKALAAYKEDYRLGIWLYGNRTENNWAHPNEKLTVYELKAYVENILNRLGVQKVIFGNLTNDIYAAGLSITTGAGRVLGSLGIVQPKLSQARDLDGEVYFAELFWDALIKETKKHKVSFAEISKFPAVKRDLALLIDKKVLFAEIEKIAYESERKLLKEVTLFDVYEGKNLPAGKKSYAVSFFLQDVDKTLNDKQIDAIMKKIQTNLEQKLGAQLR